MSHNGEAYSTTEEEARLAIAGRKSPLMWVLTSNGIEGIEFRFRPLLKLSVVSRKRCTQAISSSRCVVADDKRDGLWEPVV